MIRVAKATSGQRREQAVVVPIGRGDDDKAGSGVTEQSALDLRQAVGLDVLDHLDQGGGVEAAEADVAVEERALPQIEPSPCRFRQLGKAPLGPGELGAGDLHADDLLDPATLEQACEQLAVAAAEVEDALGTALGDDLDHAVEPPLVLQAQRLLDALFGLVLGRGVEPGLQLRLVLREAGERLLDQGAAAPEIPGDDQLALGMRLEPSPRRAPAASPARPRR
jgi:hypothetical protein